MDKRILKSCFKGREIAGLLCLAILFSLCLKDVVNSLSDSLLPTKEVTFRALADNNNHLVTIVYEGNRNELFMELKEENERQMAGWTYFEGEAGVSWTSLILPANGDAVVLRTNSAPQKYLTLLGNSGGDAGD